MSDKQINYEAIGRCKVLRDKIKVQHLERSKAINELRAVIYSLHQKGNINHVPPEIVVFDTESLTFLVDKIGRTDSDLMRAVSEYNNWCHEAGEKPVKLIEVE
ncbi:hypothetical protein [Proteus mirabilis]|uniref:hypothetical protein n=1 Tax=Proteus mirabilis TaxID=584 RepID=UPI000D7DDB29|nr:hypothetical protein [Proteus mirabilis]DAU87316.1 MAG TPA: protein of unknown function (DUF5363) [Caudoviricetes sp.]AWS54474.1 hypothetical protein AM356_06350 [Proteus mirabilis]MBG6005956.1 hypothetical protein [Proteus mirabilis]MDM3586760.1 hypothetical protein [Proteus mirabilis]MDM5172852.1 hypothetical protein [Proteus mirabilis]